MKKEKKQKKNQFKKGQGPTAAALSNQMQYSSDEGGNEKKKESLKQDSFLPERDSEKKNVEVEYVTGMSLRKELEKGKMQLMSSSSEGSNDGDEIDPYRVPLRGTSLASPVNIVSQSQKDNGDNEYLSQLRAKNKA